MDCEVICNSSTLDLKQMGLEALGDIVALKTFATELCKQGKSEPSNANEKRLLLQALLTKSGPKRKSTDSEGGKAAKRQSDITIVSVKPRKVLIGWLHYIDEKKKYAPVRVAKGGGSRQVELHLSSNKDDVINLGKTLFFQDGSSGYGSSDNMSFGIANYQQKDLTEISVDGVQLPFTLQRYIEQSKLTRVRLYLTSKQDKKDKKEEDPMNNDPTLEFKDDTLEFNDLPDYVWDSDSPDESEYPKEVNSPLEQESLKERRSLIWEQDEQYKESLAADKAKEKKQQAVLEAEIKLAERQEMLRVTRSLRVPPEPTEEEDKVIIQVRHVEQGLVKRAFKAQERVARIYDWVGSLSPNPEYFRLADFSHNIVHPTQRVCEIKSVLYMEESSSTPQVVPENPMIVNMPTFNSEEVNQIGITPPLQLLEGDTRYFHAGMLFHFLQQLISNYW